MVPSDLLLSRTKGKPNRIRYLNADASCIEFSLTPSPDFNNFMKPKTLVRIRTAAESIAQTWDLWQVPAHSNSDALVSLKPKRAPLAPGILAIDRALRLPESSLRLTNGNGRRREASRAKRQAAAPCRYFISPRRTRYNHPQQPTCGCRYLISFSPLGIAIMTRRTSRVTRRDFLATSAAVATVAAAPTVLTAQKTDKPLVVGTGEYQFEVVHNFPQLPSQYSWQTTHNVAVDKAGNLYVIHEGRGNLKDHPSIFVFDATGKFIRPFGQKIPRWWPRDRDSYRREPRVYLRLCVPIAKDVCQVRHAGGEGLAEDVPMESEKYAANEDKPTGGWGDNRFLPTNFAFLDDGGFLLVDGYGTTTSTVTIRMANGSPASAAKGPVKVGNSTRPTASGSISEPAARRRLSCAIGPIIRCSI